MQLVYLPEYIDSSPVFDRMQSDGIVFSGSFFDLMVLAQSLKENLTAVCVVGFGDEAFVTASVLRYEYQIAPIYLVDMDSSTTTMFCKNQVLTIADDDFVEILGVSPAELRRTISEADPQSCIHIYWSWGLLNSPQFKTLLEKLRNITISVEQLTGLISGPRSRQHDIYAKSDAFAGLGWSDSRELRFSLI